MINAEQPSRIRGKEIRRCSYSSENFIVSLDPDSHALVDVSALAERLRTFARERAWEQFHSPKNLAMALTGEVGELVEIFQWMTEAESASAGADPATRARIREELADVLIYLVRLADVLQIDLNAATVDKLATNAARYPVDRSHGSSAKYTELEERR